MYDLINSVITGLLGVWIVYMKVTEGKAKKKGLAGNPTRCLEHATSIARLEIKVDNIEGDIKEIKDNLK